MIEFKKDVQNELPYDRKQYQKYLNDKLYSSPIWYGVSLQLPGVFEGKRIGLTEFLKTYDGLFKKLILKLDNGALWVVNHDDKDLRWFPNKENNLPGLRNIFKERNIPDTFKGALVCTKNDLLEFLNELLAYPTTVFNNNVRLYKNLDISHSKLQFIIKTTGHSDISLLSTNKQLLREVVNENSSNSFILKEYRGTSLRSVGNHK